MSVYWAIGRIRRPILFVGGIANGCIMNEFWSDNVKRFVFPKLSKVKSYLFLHSYGKPIFSQEAYQFADRIENGHFVFEKDKS